jgi:peptidoglycan-N-acetylglucosamine deacetylase
MPSALIEAVATTATAGLFAGGCAYAAMWPQSQIFGRVVVAGSNPNQIALTYDDGPNDVATERLLEVLARHEVRATFFMIGSFVRQRPQIARAVAAAGHLIGNHTDTHPWLPWQSAARIREELTACNRALEDVLGAPVRYMRPPHGARRPAVIRIANELGLTTVNWNIIAGDWKPQPAETILNTLERGIARNRRRGRGTNIVLHDGAHTGLGQPRLPTVEATDMLLQSLDRSKFRLVTPEAWG